MIAKVVHRRALLAFAFLPLFALILAGISMLSIDRWLGDGLSALGTHAEPWIDTLRHAVFDLPPVLAGAYLLGALPWFGGLVLGHHPPRVSATFLALVCAAGGLALSNLIDLPWTAPQAVMLAIDAAVAGVLYALLTHRPGHRPVPSTESIWPLGPEPVEESVPHSSMLHTTASLADVSTLDPHDLPTTVSPEF